MKCKVCGNETPDGSLFCRVCGESLSSGDDGKPVQTFIPSQDTKTCPSCGRTIPMDSRFCPECRFQLVTAMPETGNLKKRNRIIGAIFGVGLLAAIVIGILSILIKPTINLSEYMSITAEGYDTLGKATAVFNQEQFISDYGDLLSGNDKSSANKDYAKYEALWGKEMASSKSSANRFITQFVKGSFDKDSELRNGDVIKYSWDCEKDSALEAFGVKLKAEPIEFTVEGLTELGTFDAFAGIEVSFDGIEPNGRAYINGNPTEPAAEQIWYSLDKDWDLSNGDRVTLSASIRYSNEDVKTYCAEHYGMVPDSLTKTISVSGLSTYIKTLSEIPDDLHQAMVEYGVSSFRNDFSYYNDDSELSDVQYIGEYLFTDNTGEVNWGSYHNVLCFVYKATIHNSFTNGEESYDKDTDYYWYISFRELLNTLGPDSDYSSYAWSKARDNFTIDSGVQNGWYGTKRWTIVGYKTVEELKNAVVNSLSDSYTCEENMISE